VSARVEGLIEPGDVVAVLGDEDFHLALVHALGDGAFGFRMADYDTMPDVHFAEAGITWPKHRELAPVAVEYDAEPDHEDRVYVIHVPRQGRNREHLCGLASVVLDAASMTRAHVLKAGGEAVEGVDLEVCDGRAEITRAPFSGR
jgi:hypothetical protein